MPGAHGIRRPPISSNAIVLFIFGVALACSAAPSAQTSSQLLGKPAPPLVRNDLHGSSVALQNYRGKIVLLNFWATWCSSCQIELPQFEAWQKKYDGQLQIITVSMDDSEAPVRKTVNRLHLRLPVVMGDAKLGEAYGGVLGLPVTFLVDRKGNIVAQYKGETTPETIETELKRILSRPQ